MSLEHEAKAEQRHPLLSLLEFIQEHLECAVTIKMYTAKLDGGRIVVDCPKCCHSRNIPLGSIESFLRTDPQERIAQLEQHLELACVAAGFTGVVSVEELNKVIDNQDPKTGKPKEIAKLERENEALRKGRFTSELVPIDRVRELERDLERAETLLQDCKEVVLSDSCEHDDILSLTQRINSYFTSKAKKEQP